MIRVAVSGASGRMGSTVVQAVLAADGLELVAKIDPSCNESVVDGILSTPSLVTAIERAHPDVLVDFTVPSAVVGNLEIALPAGVHCVVGTTGITQDELRRLESLAPQGTCLFIAPNFAIGAVLMMKFAEQAARYMPGVEVIELHHPAKIDSPSGTAIRTAQMIAAAQRESGIAVNVPVDTDSPARGASVEGVAVHSIRVPGMVAHQEVVFGDTGQSLSIRHDSYDRTAFMPGVVAACRAVVTRSGLVVGLENLLDL